MEDTILNKIEVFFSFLDLTVLWASWHLKQVNQWKSDKFHNHNDRGKNTKLRCFFLRKMSEDDKFKPRPVEKEKSSHSKVWKEEKN